jgi:hypothetical protein
LTAYHHAVIKSHKQGVHGVYPFGKLRAGSEELNGFKLKYNMPKKAGEQRRYLVLALCSLPLALYSLLLLL